MRAPLAGVRVVELAGIGPAPYACLLLAELGAEVIRIDRAGSPADGGVGLHRSRPSLSIDLKSETGREQVLRLVECADVLVEGLRPGATERLGLGPDDCRPRNPRLIYARMTGYGQSGPWASMAGHDINYAALSGALHLSGPAERPIPPANLVADFGGGSLFLVVGILAALVERARTDGDRTDGDRGRVIDAAMVDGAASLTTMLHGFLAAGRWIDRRESNILDGAAPFYRTYRCADARFVAVGAIEPPFFAELCRGLGVRPDTEQYDQAGWPALAELFARRFAERTRDEWAATFEGTDACLTPVLSLTEAPHHPHLAARQTFAENVGHPVPRIAPRFDGEIPPDPGQAGEPTRLLARWGLDPTTFATKESQ